MSIVLAPYIVVFEKQKNISTTERRDEYKKKTKDRKTYTADFIFSYLKTDTNLDRSEMILATGACGFLLHAAFRGCCEIQWEKLFKFSPKTFCQYIDEAYEKISEKFPNVLKEYNEIANKVEKSQEFNQ